MIDILQAIGAMIDTLIASILPHNGRTLEDKDYNASTDDDNIAS